MNLYNVHINYICIIILLCIIYIIAAHVHACPHAYIRYDIAIDVLHIYINLGYVPGV